MGFLNFFSCLTISDKVVDCRSNDSGYGDDVAGDHTNTTLNRLSCGEIKKHGGDDGASDDTKTSLKRLSWEDIKKHTQNFSRVVGSGGFSTVYLARLPDSTLAAVKVQLACTERLARVYDQELQILLRIKHPNVVRLIGKCDDRGEERVLLFEYVSNGTLYHNLHVTTLTWTARTRIAFQLAEALEYLHGMQIIHGDIKASNILLDGRQNCKLCDFGSAKLGFMSMVLPPSSTKTDRTVMGSQGYVDPHYLKTGLVSKKNDVYSFGVVLLELVTGREAFTFGRGEKLAETMVGPVAEMVDPRLRHGGGGVDMEEVEAMVCIAKRCVGSSPMLRPCATQIVASMKDKFHSIS